MALPAGRSVVRPVMAEEPFQIQGYGMPSAMAGEQIQDVRDLLTPAGGS